MTKSWERGICLVTLSWPRNKDKTVKVLTISAKWPNMLSGRLGVYTLLSCLYFRYSTNYTLHRFQHLDTLHIICDIIMSLVTSGFRTLPKNTLRSRKPENNVGPNNTVQLKPQWCYLFPDCIGFPLGLKSQPNQHLPKPSIWFPIVGSANVLKWHERIWLFHDSKPVSRTPPAHLTGIGLGPAVEVSKERRSKSGRLCKFQSWKGSKISVTYDGWVSFQEVSTD